MYTFIIKSQSVGSIWNYVAWGVLRVAGGVSGSFSIIFGKVITGCRLSEGGVWDRAEDLDRKTGQHFGSGAWHHSLWLVTHTLAATLWWSSVHLQRCDVDVLRQSPPALIFLSSCHCDHHCLKFCILCIPRTRDIWGNTCQLMVDWYNFDLNRASCFAWINSPGFNGTCV